MKKIVFIIISIIMSMFFTFNVFAGTKTKYYVKFMPMDYSNWIWSELKDVSYCQKSSDGLQYVIKYKGQPEPRIIQGKTNNKTEDKLITMTVGVDNVLIMEYEE